MTTHVITPTTLTIANDRRSGNSGLFTWLKDTMAKLEAWRSWNGRYQETLRELNGLSNRELDDIGIARCDIRMIAFESANNDRAT